MDHLCYLCLLSDMLSGLFIAALWSPAGKGLTSSILFVMFNCGFVSFPCGIMVQVWYLIVSIPDLCRLSYFNLNQIYMYSFIGAPLTKTKKVQLSNSVNMSIL